MVANPREIFVNEVVVDSQKGEADIKRFGETVAKAAVETDKAAKKTKQFSDETKGLSAAARQRVKQTEDMTRSMDRLVRTYNPAAATAKKLDALNEWGSVVALSYIAAQRIFPDYGDMADAKSLLESITRSFGYHYGVAKKIRVNTVSQSPTVTTAGSGVKGFDEFISYSEAMSPLGNADAQSCAEYCITLFSDLTRYVTMQTLFHDGGFSNTGVSMEVISKFGPPEG